jgi:glucoamylase
MSTTGDVARAVVYRAAADGILRRLDDHFDPVDGGYVCHAVDPRETTGAPTSKRLDIAIALAVIRTARPCGSHGVLDPKVIAAFTRLEAPFANEYKINRERAPDCAPAMGRYAGDAYYSDIAYYFSTLGAAQFCCNFAQAVGAGEVVPISTENRMLLADMLAISPDALGITFVEARFTGDLFGAFLHRGEMFIAMVRVHAPASGELSEQFDQTSGAQMSAKNLTWSYATFASRKSANEKVPIQRYG